MRHKAIAVLFVAIIFALLSIYVFTPVKPDPSSFPCVKMFALIALLLVIRKVKALPLNVKASPVKIKPSPIVKVFCHAF